MPTDAELLKVYLAERDVACPGCGYSLKGCASANCPECGGQIALSIGSAAIEKLDLWLLRSGTLAFGLTLVYSTGASIQQCWQAWNATINWTLFWEYPVRAVIQSAMLVVVVWLAARSWHIKRSAQREYHRRSIRWFIATFTVFAGLHIASVVGWTFFA